MLSRTIPNVKQIDAIFYYKNVLPFIFKTDFAVVIFSSDLETIPDSSISQQQNIELDFSENDRITLL